jgi:hypothetical protein
MREHLAVLLFCITIVLNGCSSESGRQPQTGNNNQQSPSCISSPDAAALRGLETLKAEVNEANYKDFGLRDPSRVKNATLGTPAKVLIVSNEKLADYKKGMNIYSLLAEGNRMIYPVTADGEAQTLITIARTGDCWTLASYGEQRLAQNLADIRSVKVNKAVSGPGAEPDQYYDIRLPKMGIDFLALNNASAGPGAAPNIQLTPLTAPVPQEVIKTPIIGTITPSSTPNYELMDKDVAFRKLGTYLKKNPKFTPEGQSSRPATDVFEALAPAARKKEKEMTSGPE